MTVRRAVLGAAALLLSGCYDPGQGVEPPLRELYFPVGLAVSPGATRLYVVNSDFDLQFNGGSLQALDLERIRALVPKRCSSDADCTDGKRCDVADSHWCIDDSGPCGPFGEKAAPQRLIAPGRCGFVSLNQPQDGGPSLVAAAVGISAFATDVVYRPRPTGPGGRLFIPARGDATLHFIEADDDSKPDRVGFDLECGQAGNDGDCADRFRIGDDPDEENTRDLRLPPEPFGIAALDNAQAVVLTHQTEGAASLFVNDESGWGDGVGSFGSGPKLEFVVAGSMPKRAIGVAAIPEPAVVDTTDIDYQPGFLVTFRDAPEVHLLRFFDDEAAQPERPFLQDVGVVGIGTNSLNFDSRGIAVASAERVLCEQSCAAGDVACLGACATIPLGVFVANRTPASLLVGQTGVNQSQTSSDDLPHFYTSVPMPFGPSRVVVGEVIDKQGQRVPRVFVICFDSRKIAIVHPDFPENVDFIETGRGPHSLSVDIGSDHAYGYIGHFTDSYIGVVDLDQRNPTYATILLTVGKPTAPRASK